MTEGHTALSSVGWLHTLVTTASVMRRNLLWATEALPTPTRSGYPKPGSLSRTLPGRQTLSVQVSGRD